MRESRKSKQINESSWHDRIMVLVSCLIPFIIIFLLPFESFEPEEEYEGIVTGMHQAQTRTGSAPVEFLVTLDDGSIARVNASQMGTFQKERRVVVRKYVSSIFRRTRYKFVKYIEPSADGIEKMP